jgi:outer membrane protein assembly factor BamA
VLDLTRQLTTRTVGAAGLQYENGRTVNDPLVACSKFAQCRPEDYALSQFGRGVGIASTSVTHDRTNDVVNPSQGWRGRTELRVGQTFSELVSSLTFFRTTAEGSAYRPFLGGVVATRLQLSRAFAPGAELVGGTPLLPQQERLYAGGQNSVRGFQQNLLGPVIYQVYNVETVDLPGGGRAYVAKDTTIDPRPVPAGGTALIVGNLEYRRALPGFGGQLQAAAFVDVGSVWEATTGQFDIRDTRATPGLGLRLGTPLGPFRLDVGYQPYPPRAGRALYFTKGEQVAQGSIYCASPGNTVDITRLGESDIFNCPESFRPARRAGLLSRFVFHFGLGQAF